MTEVTRDFTVAVFIVSENKVLLHWHHKLQRWLPPGGHIEPNELPDEAALREVEEETGIVIRLICERPNTADGSHNPVQLCRPAGLQLESISPGREHIDLIYYAEPVNLQNQHDGTFFDSNEWMKLDLGIEIENWCNLAIGAVSNQAQRDDGERTHTPPS
jgi:8-oxo-dGTP pyrophosphatase MutT (NUDIX family)